MQRDYEGDYEGKERGIFGFHFHFYFCNFCFGMEAADSALWARGEQHSDTRVWYRLDSIGERGLCVACKISENLPDQT